MPTNESDLHRGHRQRLKKRFLEEGLDNFEPHNILELLLFFGIPRRDTNPLAHQLLDTYGSFSAVLDAPFDDLVKMKGMTESAAFLLKLCTGVSRAYDIDKADHTVLLNSLAAIEKYIQPFFKGKTNEEFYAFYLDNACKVITSRRLSEGGLNSAPVSIRRIVEYAISSNCTNVIVAHNHPHGLASPSHADCVTTIDIYRALKTCEVNLLDHIIVSPSGCTSMLNDGFFCPDNIF